MSEQLESTAQRIADRGRDALLERLRPAFADAARAHADALQLSDEQIEEMVQRAADRADGLQWRRALAAVATEELGIGLGEALGHPAVVRAQEIVGAPSYGDDLAAVAAPPAAVQPPEPPPAEPEEAPPASPEPALAPAPAPPLAPTPAPPLAPAPAPPLAPMPGPGEVEPVRVSAVHLGGVANLAAGTSDIELRLSEHGLDIVRGADETLGRLRWDEIRALDVPTGRSIRRRRRESRTNLVVRTAHGEATFAVPAVSPEELREHVDPLLRRYARPSAPG